MLWQVWSQLPTNCCKYAAQAVDAAKKRAVGQHVDYDTFKNMVRVARSIANTQHSSALNICRNKGIRTLQVAVAHLRPLQDPSLTQTGQLEPYLHCIRFGGLTIILLVL